METILKCSRIPHIEIEFRMGRRAATFFDTNVGEGIYTKVLRRLLRYQEWEKVENSRCDIYYALNGNKRIVYNLDTDDQECVSKEIVENIDYADHRVAMATEIPATYTSEEKFTMTRKRIRTSFFRKGLRIDVSKIEGQKNKESEDPCSYQIELEILDPSSLTKAKLENHYAKIECVRKLFT